MLNEALRAPPPAIADPNAAPLSIFAYLRFMYRETLKKTQFRGKCANKKNVSQRQTEKVN
jgi:hypothetical protein